MVVGTRNLEPTTSVYSLEITLKACHFGVCSWCKPSIGFGNQIAVHKFFKSASLPTRLQANHQSKPSDLFFYASQYVFSIGMADLPSITHSPTWHMHVIFHNLHLPPEKAPLVDCTKNRFVLITLYPNKYSIIGSPIHDLTQVEGMWMTY